MTILVEGEQQFHFPPRVTAERLDVDGRRPLGWKVVDFIVDDEAVTWLVEVKDPANTRAQQHNNAREYTRKVARAEDTLADDYARKARDSYCQLHLDARDKKPIRFLLVVSAIDAALLLAMTEKVNRRIRHESTRSEPWKRTYISQAFVASPETIGKYINGAAVVRNPEV